jgi:phosphoglycolate phosphatase-like HAD superfamily hydrolase
VRSSSSELLALDLDGTLIDPRPRQVAVAAALLEDRGAAPLDEDAFWDAKRAGATTGAALEVLGYPEPLPREVAAAWRERVEEPRWQRLDRPFQGVGELLADLRAGGWELALLTARRRPAGPVDLVRRLGWSDRIGETVVVDPARSSEEKAAWLREHAPRRFIGDTESDGEAARRAGVEFVAVATGQRSAEYLRERGFRVVPGLAAACEGLS